MFDLKVLKKAHRNLEKMSQKYPILDKGGTHLGKHRYGNIETRAKSAFLRYAEEACYGAPQLAMRFKRASDKAFVIWIREMGKDD